MCNDRCKVVLDKNDLAVVKNKAVIIGGKRNKTDRLWDIPIQKRTITEDNYKHPLTHKGLYAAQLLTRKVKTKQTQQHVQQVRQVQHKQPNRNNVNYISYGQCVSVVNYNNIAPTTAITKCPYFKNKTNWQSLYRRKKHIET